MYWNNYSGKRKRFYQGNIMNKNNILIFLVIINSTFLFGTDKIDLKIGFVGPLSGNLTEYGIPQLEAIQFSSLEYKDYFNIEIIPIDDEGNPQKSQEAAQELLDKKVDYVIGHVTSAATAAALQIYNNKTLIINPSSTSPFINQEKIYKTFIRTIPNDFSQSEKILEFINDNEFNNVCVIYEYNDYARNILLGINNIKENLIFQYLILDLSNGQLYEDKNNTSNFNEFIANTDLVIYLGYYKDFINIYSFLRDNFNYSGEILGSDGVPDSGLFDEVDINYTNTYALNASDVAENEAIKIILDKYRNEYSKEPGTYFTRTYITNEMILHYLSKNPELFTFSIEEKALRIANDFKKMPQKSLIGNLYFNSTGDITINDYKIYEIINNKFVEYR